MFFHIGNRHLRFLAGLVIFLLVVAVVVALIWGLGYSALVVLYGPGYYTSQDIAFHGIGTIFVLAMISFVLGLAGWGLGEIFFR